MDLVEACSTYVQLASILAVLALVWSISFHPLLLLLASFIQKRAWWSRALAPMKKLMINFGYPSASDPMDAKFPRGITERICAEGFAWTCLVCLHHSLCAWLLWPVVQTGWAAAGARSRQSFLVGILAAASFDLYDFVCSCIKCFLPGVVFTHSHPTKFWIIMGLHHITSILTVLPLCRFFKDDEDFHAISFALLFAAGVCYGTGQYKYTLNSSTRTGLLQIRAIALLQFNLILYTRAWVWGTRAAGLLSTVLEKAPHHPELYVTCVGLFSMSLFNLIMVLDSAGQLVKWCCPCGDGFKLRTQVREKKTS